MKYDYAALAFGLGASGAAIQSRTAGCCFEITVSGGPGSGPLGQLGDGQNRVGPGYSAATYCLSGTGITDGSGRGCILTSPTTQFQCDVGASPTTGFTITPSGEIEYNGSGTFYECAVNNNGVYNIYTSPLGTNCSEVTLTTVGGECAASSSSAAPTPTATTAPASASTVTLTETVGTTVYSTVQGPTVTTYGPGTTVVSTVPGPTVSAYGPGTTVVSTATVVSTVTPSGSTCIASSVYSSLTSAASPSSTAPTYGSCTAQEDSCRTAPNANEAFCSSQYCSCLASAGALSQGPSYCQVASASTTATGTAPVTPPASPSSTAPSYASCTTQEDSCRTAPNANQAFCSSQYCSCLASAGALSQGPSYCQVASASTTVTATASPSPTAPTYASCTAQEDSCRTAPNANQAYCSSEYCSCLASAGALSQGPSYCQPATASSTVTATASPSPTAPTYASCTAQEDSCRTAPNANEAYCSSQYCSCLASAGALSQGPSYCQPATASTTATAPAGPSATTCPASLSGAYQYPHLIVPVNSASPTTAYGTSYNGELTSTISSVFNFDIPASYAGHTCTLVFLLPTLSSLQTSSYTTSGTGGIEVTQLVAPATVSTTYASLPAAKASLGTFTITEGSSTVIATGPCAAGDTLSYELSATGTYALDYFQDYNGPAIGLYIVEC